MTQVWQKAREALRAANRGISAKLYCFAFLSLLAVATLSISSSKTTETAAQRLYGVGFVGILNSTRLDLLLERHRRIVESMPSEVDRDRLQAGRNELGQIKQRLSELMIQIAPADADGSSLESRITESLPALFGAADQVSFYANEFAQDKAVEEANGYVHVAAGIERLIKNYRDLRLEEAQEALAFVSATTKSLAIWVLLCAFVAIILI